MALGSVECFTLGYDSWKCIAPTAVHEGEPCEEARVIPTMHHARFYAAVTARDYEVFIIGEYVYWTSLVIGGHVYQTKILSVLQANIDLISSEDTRPSCMIF